MGSIFLAHHLLDEAVGELELGSLGALQLGFEDVAERHQLVDFGDDAVLFRDWAHASSHSM